MRDFTFASFCFLPSILYDSFGLFTLSPPSQNRTLELQARRASVSEAKAARDAAAAEAERLRQSRQECVMLMKEE